MKWLKNYSWLIAIVMLAGFLRFWQLGVVPVSPDWDEAALGYNAYSILHTGRDEYDTFLPRALRSFDDYKPPLYTYLVIPSIAVFGLEVWAVRLPSAIMGTLAVLGVYFLLLEIFEKDKRARMYALLAALLLAISPWHLQFSRIAFEANSGLTLNIWGLYALLRGRRSVSWMSVAAFIFGLALYAYHSERVFVPLLLIAASVTWRKELFHNWKALLLPIVIGCITVLPLLPVVLDKTSLTRLQGTSSLADQTGLLMRSVGKLTDDATAGDKIGAIFDNRRIVYAQKIIEGYISHFSIRWLFILGDNDRHHAPDNGLLYLWELPFILLGIFVLYKRRDAISSFLFAWFLLAPVAASPTSETPHAIRTLVFLPIFQIFTAFGLIAAVDWVKNTQKMPNKIMKLLVAGACSVIVLGIALNIFYYFHMYYAHMNREYSRFWQYGYKQAVLYTQAHKSKYKKIIVSPKLEQPHMFFLFYTKYDPATYLKHGGTATGGFAENRNAFDIYQFRPIDWEHEVHDGATLYIGTPKEIPTGSKQSIYYLNGEEAMRIAE